MSGSSKHSRSFLLIFTLLLMLAATVQIWGRLFFPLPYREIVFTHARRCDLDPYLVLAMIREESSFDPQAVSRRGALGLMQVMPETGAWIAGQLGEEDFRPEQLFDPRGNVRYGTWYIAALLAEFKGDVVRALVAYNAGSNRVREWLAQGTWDGRLATLDNLPYRETRHYVMKIMRSYKIYRFLYTRERTNSSSP